MIPVAIMLEKPPKEIPHLDWEEVLKSREVDEIVRLGEDIKVYIIIIIKNLFIFDISVHDFEKYDEQLVLSLFLHLGFWYIITKFYK